MANILQIKDLFVTVHDKDEGDKEIIKGLNLSVNEGEIHAIMGPNGSGKSTLSNILAGKKDYEVTSGEIIYKGQNLSDLEIEERAAAGIFLAFQYPISIPGVSSMNFVKESLNSIRKTQGLAPYDTMEFMKIVKENQKKMSVVDDMLKRSINVGFSGGEKKRFDIMHMLMLNPTLAILDETDSGLDIDALKLVSEAVNNFFTKEKSLLIITHYQRLLNYIKPDFVHIMRDGQIIESGDAGLAKRLEDHGYNNFV